MLPHMEIQRSEYSFSNFLKWMKTDSIDLSPSFQRRPVWNKPAKSFLIDTIVRGLPIPIIFLREKTDLKSLETVMEVVDGQQRLRTVMSYIDPQAIPKYDESRDNFSILKKHNPEIAGKPFSALSDRYKERILTYKITTHILPPDTSDRQVLDIFRRMNSTGKNLNAQELRNAEFAGEFISSVYDFSLQRLDYWRKWKLFNEQAIAEMKEAEFVSELFILALNGITELDQKIINRYYKEYDINFTEGERVERRVSLLLEKLDSDYGTGFQKSIFRKKMWFYALFSALYEHYFGLKSELSSKQKHSFSKSIAEELTTIDEMFERREVPEDLLALTSGRSNRKSTREIMASFIQEAMFGDDTIR